MRNQYERPVPRVAPGRTVGMLLLLQLAGLIVPFVLLLPLTTGPQNYLANAHEHALQIKLAVGLLWANGALTIGITIVAWPVLRERSEATAQGLMAASVIMLLLQAVDNIHVLSMLSLSQQHSAAGGPAEPLQSLAAVVGATRRWAHISELAAIDCWIFLLYRALYRFALVPRAVAVFGLVTVVLHFTGIPLRLFLGLGTVPLTGEPMALSHVTLAIWLMAKGFDEHLRPRRAEGHGALNG